MAYFVVAVAFLIPGSILFSNGCDQELKPWCTENRNKNMAVVIEDVRQPFVTVCEEWVVIPEDKCEAGPCVVCNLTSRFPSPVNNIVKFRILEVNGTMTDDVCFLKVDNPYGLDFFKSSIGKGPMTAWPAGHAIIPGALEPQLQCSMEPYIWDVYWCRVGFGLLMAAIASCFMYYVILCGWKM
jgi:hypothetical protein